MNAFFINLVIGIIGGVYSGIIVSRIDYIRGSLAEEMQILRLTTYHLGSLQAFFDLTEEIMKISSDTSDEIEEGIKNDPNYLKTHDILRTDDVMNVMKKEMLDKSVENILNLNDLILKQKQFVILRNETIDTITKYKKIEKFTFSIVDKCNEEIKELKNKYDQCLKDSKALFIKRIVSDRVIIVLGVVFLIICACLLKCYIFDIFIKIDR